MSRKEKSRIDTGGGNNLEVNPFGGLGGLGNLPLARPVEQTPASTVASHDQRGAANTDQNRPANRERNRLPNREENADVAREQNAGGSCERNAEVCRDQNAVVARDKEAPAVRSAASVSPAAVGKKTGRIDIRREKSGRGGKVVTTLSGEALARLGADEREALLKQLKNRFGCGGRCEGALLEVQGDWVGQLTPVLTQMGWRVVRTGG